MKRLVILALVWSVSVFAQSSPGRFPQPVPHDFTAPNFQFKTGDHLDTRIHYYTLGSPEKRADGKVGNAVLILHGTGGSGRSLLGPTFAGMLFCSGCLLDATKYFIISPDNLGHGSSSKPSDGLRMGFPHYDYDDMVALQQALLNRGRPPCSERQSLRKDCGWKDGDSGGSAQRQKTQRSKNKTALTLTGLLMAGVTRTAAAAKAD